MVYDRCGTEGDGIAGLGHAKLCHGTDIACAQFRYLNRILTTEQVQLADLFLGILIDIVDGAVRLSEYLPINGSTMVLNTLADKETWSLYFAVKRSPVETSTPIHSNLSGVGR